MTKPFREHYLDAADPGAFLDMPIKDRRTYLGQPPERLTECPRCKGHGGWHLKLNAYGPGKHFDCSCRQCWGWGWVEVGSIDAECVHEFKEDDSKVTTPGRCMHAMVCIRCSHVKQYDSSD